MGEGFGVFLFVSYLSLIYGSYRLFKAAFFSIVGIELLDDTPIPSIIFWPLLLMSFIFPIAIFWFLNVAFLAFGIWSFIT